jgi:hypothetical protein
VISMMQFGIDPPCISRVNRIIVGTDISVRRIVRRRPCQTKCQTKIRRHRHGKEGRGAGQPGQTGTVGAEQEPILDGSRGQPRR